MHRTAASSALIVAFAVGLAACRDTQDHGVDGATAVGASSGTVATGVGPSPVTRAARASMRPGTPRVFGEAPPVPTGPLAAEVSAAARIAFGDNLAAGHWGPEQSEALRTLSASGDVRMAWVIADLMRIAGDRRLASLLAMAAGELTGVDLEGRNPWGTTVDHLIAWDIPAPPGYLDVKRQIYTLIEPKWGVLFQPGKIDWRHVSWGGVGIDDRPYDATDRPCDCIPAVDNPEVVDAADATWLDDDVVFGVAIGGEYRAYPRRIMEVREMVNDTLGGRHLGIPYCTLCGSAQAYLTDAVPEGTARPVLRTSGLLIRSNKVMYDLHTGSVFDTFRGDAVTGPLAQQGIALSQVGVVTTRWGDWRRAHPETTVLVESLALGRDFDLRNTRDSHGPIFPIGDVDPRLPVQEDVLGVVTESGIPVAFHLKSVLARLEVADAVAYDNVRVVLDGGGVRAIDADGNDLGGHQAFWFAWSQFYPETRLWAM